jgi:hypothetical protein
MEAYGTFQSGLKFEPDPPAVAADTPYATLGGMVSVSRERVRQIEEDDLGKLRMSSRRQAREAPLEGLGAAES